MPSPIRGNRKIKRLPCCRRILAKMLGRALRFFQVFRTFQEQAVDFLFDRIHWSSRISSFMRF
jgi:hypothetical protein